MLAGAQCVVRFGVRAPLAALETGAQVRLRQALVPRLRVLVPALDLPTVVTGGWLAVRNAGGEGFAGEAVGVLAVLVWTVVTFAGTVPIYAGVLDWRPEAPPADWRAVVRRWELLDTVRTVAAVLAFAAFPAGAAAR